MANGAQLGLYLLSLFYEEKRQEREEAISIFNFPGDISCISLWPVLKTQLLILTCG